MNTTSEDRKPGPVTPDRDRTGPVRKPSPSVIGSDVRIVGNIVARGEAQIDGVVEGDIEATGVTIGEEGSVTGQVRADSLIVRGKIQGGLIGNKVQLCVGANVQSDIIVETLSIEPGALFEGRVQHASNSSGKGKRDSADNKAAGVSSGSAGSSASSKSGAVGAVGGRPVQPA